MKKTIYLFVLVFLMMATLQAQQSLKVERIEALTQKDQGEFSFPQLTPDGSKVIFSGPKFTGLFMLDLEKRNIETLNNEIGAGYQFQISNDGQFVIYRSFTFKNGRKFYSLKTQKLSDKSVSVLEKESRELSPPRVVDGKIVYLRKEQPVTITLSPKLEKASTAINTSVLVRNRTIVLIEGEQQRELKPLGEGIYLWPSLSPDGTKLLFTFAGDGTYISDLDGNILTRIGYANAPVWSPDGKWIAYMVDHDNGHFYTDSEIFISSMDGKQKIQVTNTKDIIEMYPNWGSKDLTKLVFSSLSGQIFLATLKTE